MGGREADLTSPVRRNVPGALATGVAGITSQKLPKGFLIGYGRNWWLTTIDTCANMSKSCVLRVTDRTIRLSVRPTLGAMKRG